MSFIELYLWHQDKKVQTWDLFEIIRGDDGIRRIQGEDDMYDLLILGNGARIGLMTAYGMLWGPPVRYRNFNPDPPPGQTGASPSPPPPPPSS